MQTLAEIQPIIDKLDEKFKPQYRAMIADTYGQHQVVFADYLYETLTPFTFMVVNIYHNKAILQEYCNAFSQNFIRQNAGCQREAALFISEYMGHIIEYADLPIRADIAIIRFKSSDDE